MIRKETNLVMTNTMHFKLKRILLRMCILVLILVFIIHNVGSPSNPDKNIYRDEQVLNKARYEETTFMLVNEVDAYIKSQTNRSKLDAKKVVEVCDSYDLDIKFLLAQGQLESQFGTKGIAVRTNSVFNIGTFDDGTILYRYKNPNHSLEPYAQLIKNKYAINGKTEYDLLKYKQFKDARGKRYASARNYEKILSQIIKDISTKTKIDSLQAERQSISLTLNNT
jgi:flagellum-specific peptidoglycan hydrolase FlgJ